ncbi:hypothetical protein [Jannaschia aquimarina]|uniref:Uncharacterized protein n=1 Tax=Jannaschia aquimarina TaxID=935700 RepID=A0A0D1EJZ7_9RHOB|nr:hypothetical protein [Jannaschia aquimarina]KIT17889.1 hypothetical protein jaqu_03430 [Jannaschia aquimarina]SNT14035.1 hypothetical protein SAMN05421775_106157 [Jannaschia aquimarina]
MRAGPRPVTALRAFFSGPLGALQAMHAETPRAVHAAMALVVAALIHVVLDYGFGPWAFPHTVEPGGKRADGPAIGAAVAVARIFSAAAILWMAGRLIYRLDISGAAAMWMTVPYGLAEIGLDLVELTVVIVYRLTSLDMYGSFFMMGYVAGILVMVVSVRVLYRFDDWLSALPVGMGAAILSYFLPPLVLPAAGVYLLWRSIAR